MTKRRLLVPNVVAPVGSRALPPPLAAAMRVITGLGHADPARRVLLPARAITVCAPVLEEAPGWHYPTSPVVAEPRAFEVSITLAVRGTIVRNAHAGRWLPNRALRLRE